MLRKKEIKEFIFLNIFWFICKCAKLLIIKVMLKTVECPLRALFAAAVDEAYTPPPKPILHLGYVIRTHHINFQQNRTTLSMVYSSYR